MKFNPEGYKQVRWIFWAAICLSWFFAFTLIKDSFKTRKDFKVITGIVTEEGETKVKGKGNNYSDVYYFKLSNHGQLLGIGTDENLKPILDQNFKGLTVGDSINVTFEENWATEKEPVNRLVHEIKRNNEVIYDNIPWTYWSGRMKAGLICLAFGILTAFGLLLIKLKYNDI